MGSGIEGMRTWSGWDPLTRRAADTYPQGSAG